MRTSKEILEAQRKRNKRRQNIQECVAGCGAGIFLSGLLIAGILYDGGLAQAADEELIPEAVQEYAEEIGAEYGICPELLEAIAYRESRCDETAYNDGCTGLMQISVRWHKERMEKLGVTDLTDGYQNMLVAADYLAQLFEENQEVSLVLDIYHGDTKAWSNYGKGIVSSYAEGILEMSAELEVEHGK